MTFATVQPPHSPEAEASVIGQLLARPRIAGEVVGTLLEPGHFHTPAFRALYKEIVSAYYADEPIDPLTIGELCAKTLSRTWQVDESEAVRQVQGLAAGQAAYAGEAVNHAKLIKRDSDYRALLELAATITRAVDGELQSPDEVAAQASHDAMKIATSTLLTQELVSFQDLGRRFVKEQRRLMAAKAAGVEVGAYFGLKFLDNFVKGLKPTEVFILAGEPGGGKSAVSWVASRQFAERQLRKPEDHRVGTLILSLEMGEEDSSTRVAQSLTAIDGGTFREATTTEDDLRRVIAAWGARKGIPLYFNFTSVLRASQMRALIIEAIRRHNVGLVVIDHMRYFDMDRRYQRVEEEDEAKAKFLKQDIATQLNVAVMVLAHTTKAIEQREDRRPRLSDLRGGGMVAAHADFVGFVYRPYNHARQDAIDDGAVKRTDAELIYAKNRHGLDGGAPFFFDPSTMSVN